MRIEIDLEHLFKPDVSVAGKRFTVKGFHFDKNGFFEKSGLIQMERIDPARFGKKLPPDHYFASFEFCGAKDISVFFPQHMHETEVIDFIFDAINDSKRVVKYDKHRKHVIKFIETEVNGLKFVTHFENKNSKYVVKTAYFNIFVKE